MRYSNNSTRGAGPRGFGALSQEKGKRIWNQILFHDDGKIGYGGTRTIGIGGGGGGKSTIETKFARKSYQIEGLSKKDFLGSYEEIGNESDPNIIQDWIKTFGQRIHPETTLWRGREYDIWNVLTVENQKQFYPNDIVKPLRVHTYRKSPLTFSETDSETGQVSDMKRLDIKEYLNIAELTENLKEYGNNIIYPPLHHYMSNRLKEAINTKRNASDQKNKWGSYIDKKYLAPEIKYLVERDIFLFELFEYLFRENSEGPSKKFYTAIIDESHDLFRANAPDVYYWIIECMVDIIIDTRKLNLSLACMTHDRTLIDHRIYKRASHLLWLPGSEPGGNTTVDGRLIRKLVTGQGVNEGLMTGEIGGFTFNPLPKEVPILTVHGMTERKSLSSTITEDEFSFMSEEEA